MQQIQRDTGEWLRDMGSGWKAVKDKRMFTSPLLNRESAELRSHSETPFDEYTLEPTLHSVTPQNTTSILSNFQYIDNVCHCRWTCAPSSLQSSLSFHLPTINSHLFFYWKNAQQSSRTVRQWPWVQVKPLLQDRHQTGQQTFLHQWTLKEASNSPKDWV